MIRNYGTGGLKAQKLIAQGIALGLVSEFVRPERAKALIFRALLELLPLQGADNHIKHFNFNYSYENLF